MNEAEYQRFKRRIWRLTGQGSPHVDKVYERMVELEEQGKLADEIVAETLEPVREMVRALTPFARKVVGRVEQESGMTFDDFVWLRDYAPPEDESDRA